MDWSRCEVFTVMYTVKKHTFLFKEILTLVSAEYENN